jgi:hypothetical protein
MCAFLPHRAPSGKVAFGQQAATIDMNGGMVIRYWQ